METNKSNNIPKIDFGSLYTFPRSLSDDEIKELISSNVVDIDETLKHLLNTQPTSEEMFTLQIKLIRILTDFGGKFSEVDNLPKNLPYDVYELMLQNYLNPDLLFNTALLYREIDEAKKSMELAIKYGANVQNIYYIPSQFSLELANYMLKNGTHGKLIIDVILSKAIINHCDQPGYPNSDIFTQEDKDVLNLVVTKGTTINEGFTYRKIISLNSNEVMISQIKMVESLVRDYNLKLELALEYAIKNGFYDLAKNMLELGADPNARTHDEYLTLIENATDDKQLDIINLLINHGAKVDYEVYVSLILGFSTNTIDILKKLDRFDTNAEILEFLKAIGISPSKIQTVIDIHNLMRDYAYALDGETNLFSSKEIDLLDSKKIINELEGAIENYDVGIINSHGFNALQLAVIGGKYELARKMIEAGYDIYTKNNNVPIIKIILVINNESKSFNLLKLIILEKLKSIDIDLGRGESLADAFLSNENEFTQKIIEKTQDPLFYFCKKNANPAILSDDKEQTHIAISQGKNLWSTGAWAFARLAQEKHKDVSFYLINPETIKQNGGDTFIKQFDAFINPGAGDTYPRDLKEFKKEDCRLYFDIEKHYQNILEKSYQLHIPYLGMCAGAQHFSMYHGGSLKPLKEYEKGKHTVNFIKGTLPHFMSLTEEQQKNVLEDCSFTDISVKGDTAHHYAAIIGKLGNDLQLGAISKDNTKGEDVAMAYAHNNGIRYATQFHPEHYYNDLYYEELTSSIIHQNAWLDNFISIAKMHHEYRVNNATHPEEYMHGIKARLEECTKKIMWENLELIHDLFKYGSENICEVNDSQ